MAFHTHYTVISNARAKVEAAADWLSGGFCWFLSQLWEELTLAQKKEKQESLFYSQEATDRTASLQPTKPWEPVLTGSLLLCRTPSTFPRSHNAPDCTLHPSLPDTFPSHHHCTQHDAPPDTFAGTSEILPSTWKEPISWSLFCFSADCTMCHSFSKLICCFRETWNLWEHVNSSTIYAPLQICNTDWNWHSRWPTPYISLTKNCLVIHFSSLAN